MLVNSKKLKKLRQSKNWTQQNMADACGLSMRTIQRIEKDGVASNDTVSAYAAVFEVQASEFLITADQFGDTQQGDLSLGFKAIMGSILFFGGVVAGAGLSLWLF
ncbi:MAG: transcriptional regulator with XRE-family HTH domain [Arenicella sp.]|jgi:transcriptional regulator with XRE-family HTH domain